MYLPNTSQIGWATLLLDSMAFNLGFQTKCILNLWSTSFHPTKVSFSVFLNFIWIPPSIVFLSIFGRFSKQNHYQKAADKAFEEIGVSKEAADSIKSRLLKTKQVEEAHLKCCITNSTEDCDVLILKSLSYQFKAKIWILIILLPVMKGKKNWIWYNYNLTWKLKKAFFH